MQVVYTRKWTGQEKRKKKFCCVNNWRCRLYAKDTILIQDIRVDISTRFDFLKGIVESINYAL